MTVVTSPRRNAATRVNLSEHDVVAAALRLTRRVGLAGLSMRALADELAALVALAQVAGDSPEGEQAFREALALRHAAFDKALWMSEESRGKAYELGNFISDTWNRIARPLVKPDPASELAEVFSPVRIERMKLLLDDLQARVDPIAAHAVNNHLDAWSARLHRPGVELRRLRPAD